MTRSEPRVAVLVVAAGSGTRLGVGPKAFVRLGEATLLEHAIHAVSGMDEPVRLVVAAPVEHLAEAEGLARLAGADRASVVVVAGGDTRQASVAAALAGLARAEREAGAAPAEEVLVHDVARPGAPSALFEAVLGEVRRTGEAVVPGLPVADTIKRVGEDGRVAGTVERADLAAVQTPQGFPRRVLEEAHAAARAEATDDAVLAAEAGHPVSVVAGDPRAHKITTLEDLEAARRALAPAAPAFRVGVGTDTHAFDADAPLRLACLDWPGEPGLAGHSDGDVVAHAIVDALLSAAGLGDIGGVFGTDDPRLAGAHGDVFLREAVRMLDAAGLRIGNVAVQVVGVRPRFAPRRREAEAGLARLLGAPVSVSATTTDGLGFTGRGEGITAIATALLASHSPGGAPPPSRLGG